MSRQVEKPDLSRETIERLVKEHPEWANGIARMSPYVKNLQQRLGQAEMNSRMSVEEGAVHANVNFTYNRYFEARHKYAENFSTLLVGTIDEMYEVCGNIKNLHKMVHPPFRLNMGLIALLAFGLLIGGAIAYYPPYGIALGKFVTGTTDGLPNFYGLVVLFACLFGIAYLFLDRRKKREQ